MIAELNPGLILILGALLIPLVPQIARGAISLALPLVGLAQLLLLPRGEAGQIALFGYQLVTLRIDDLSFVFGLIFLIAAFLASIYALHVKGWVEPMAAQMYAGSAIGAVFAGDLITLFVFWEITAITSVFLIWARRSERSFDTGMRYLIVQVGSGVLLLSGVLLYVHQTGSVAFDVIAQVTTQNWQDASAATWLILIAFGIKAAFPFLHNWLQDAYPEATPSGTVWLSAFTTKLAIYALARGFPGSDLLVPIGIVMAIFPLFYAAVENDLRRVLAYALNNQLGFMVIGVGIGTDLAIAGAAAQAFCHILYKALLYMSVGAVLFRVGTAKATELGGLARAMPWTCAFCIIGALSISAPLFAGFISKSLIISAAMKEGYFAAWIVMLFASAGVFLTTGLRVPYAAFFQGRAPREVAEAPNNMLAAMGLVSALSLGLGLYPTALYALLPNGVTYEPYTLEHVVTQMQLLAFAALAFALLVARGFYPRDEARTLVDFDWFYRRLGYNLGSTLLILGRSMINTIGDAGRAAILRVEQNISRTHNPDGMLARTWSTGVMAFLATAMLAGYLVIFYAPALVGAG